jgi:hypothetical protein
MREWEIVIAGDGPHVDATWAAILESALMPYGGVVTLIDDQVRAELTVMTAEGRSAAHLALEIWSAMQPRARLTSLVVTQVQALPRRARAASGLPPQIAALLRPSTLAG